MHRSKKRPTSFDHLVGAQQDRWGYRKTERRGGLAVLVIIIAAASHEAAFQASEVLLSQDLPERRHTFLRPPTNTG